MICDFVCKKCGTYYFVIPFAGEGCPTCKNSWQAPGHVMSKDRYNKLLEFRKAKDKLALEHGFDRDD